MGIRVDEVTILESKPGEWDEEYLGCAGTGGSHPHPPMPRLIQGQSILLSVWEVIHEYHSGGMWLVYCGVVE